MPTVLLLDKSLSMKRPVSTGNVTETRLSMAKSGLSVFLTYMENTFPLEQISFMTFSSTCNIIVPFTRDHLELKESLNDITVGDKTDVCNALKTVIDSVVKEWGVFNPVQIVLITDGTLGMDRQQTALCFPFPCKLHMLLMAVKEDFHKFNEQVESLCQMMNTSPDNLLSPTIINKESVRKMFLQLCQTHYRPVTSTLKCGHLQSKISFSPSPLMTQSFHDVATSPQHIFKNPYTITEFPLEMNICGFLDVGCLSAPSVYSKHFVIDADPDVAKANRLVKVLLEDGNLEEEKRHEAEKPSFRVLLHGSLKCESKVALVRLG